MLCDLKKLVQIHVELECENKMCVWLDTIFKKFGVEWKQDGKCLKENALVFYGKRMIEFIFWISSSQVGLL